MAMALAAEAVPSPSAFVYSLTTTKSRSASRTAQSELAPRSLRFCPRSRRSIPKRASTSNLPFGRRSPQPLPPPNPRRRPRNQTATGSRKLISGFPTIPIERGPTANCCGCSERLSRRTTSWTDSLSSIPYLSESSFMPGCATEPCTCSSPAFAAPTSSRHRIRVHRPDGTRRSIRCQKTLDVAIPGQATDAPPLVRVAALDQRLAVAGDHFHSAHVRP